jgi:hypothetical protein
MTHLFGAGKVNEAEHLKSGGQHEQGDQCSG